jgi:serine/threonine-protein kinase
MSAERTIGNYVLGPVLGRGGTSEVHAAEHRFLGDRVAIKRLRSHLAGDAAATAAFVAEATRTRAIEHPSVVRVFDVGSDGDAFYLVMERLDGESLAARLARDGRLDEAEVRRLGAAIADGLAAAHARGIVHRDLKPGNIVLVAGEPKIIDFGIAREVARAATGSRIGTIAYMAPEQLTGGLVAPCVDIWALGVVLYEAIAGRLPFDGFADGRSPQLFEAAPRLAGLAPVSPALEALIASCLERDPARRPASMAAIAEALREAAVDQRFTEELSPSAGAPPAGGRSSRRRLRALIALAVVAGAAGGITWAVSFRGSSSGPISPEPTASAATMPLAATATLPPPQPATAPQQQPPAAATPATVEVHSIPAGASIVIDGIRVGTTPASLAIELPASILVTRTGYRPWRIRAERAGRIDARLQPTRPVRPAPPRPVAGETLD